MNINNYVLEKYATPITNVEPLTLQQAKDSMSITSNAQDTLITALITEARQGIERLTGLSLVPSVIVALIDNTGGDIELPLGPYVSNLEINNAQGDPVTDFELRGLQFKTLHKPNLDYMTCAYEAGYTATGVSGFPTMPSELLGCIKDQVSFLFENRGENGSYGFSPKVYRTVRKYTRNPLFI